MGEILRRATVVELDPATVEVTDLRIDGELITARGPNLPARPGDLETDLTGKLVMPGLVSAHTHLAFTLGRSAPPTAPRKVPIEPLEQTWWRMDRALDHEAIEISVAAGALEALQNGCTTVFDHHSSPTCIDGSLAAVQRGLEHVGLRGVLSYAVSDRLGPEYSAAALHENERHISEARGRCRGMVGAQASSSLDEPTLLETCALAKRTHVGVHINVAESGLDERDCQERFQKGLGQRLADAGLAGPLSIVAHGTYLGWEDLAQLLQHGTWMCHVPRANMLSGLGYAPAGKFGPRLVLGGAHLPIDPFADAKSAVQRAADAGSPIDLLKTLAAGHKLASQVYGRAIGPLREGAVADLLVMDYVPLSPLSAQSLAHHLQLFIGPRCLEAVMVDGCWRSWARQPLKLDAAKLSVRSSQTATHLWETMANL